MVPKGSELLSAEERTNGGKEDGTLCQPNREGTPLMRGLISNDGAPLSFSLSALSSGVKGRHLPSSQSVSILSL